MTSGPAPYGHRATPQKHHTTPQNTARQHIGAPLGFGITEYAPHAHGTHGISTTTKPGTERRSFTESGGIWRARSLYTVVTQELLEILEAAWLPPLFLWRCQLSSVRVSSWRPFPRLIPPSPPCPPGLRLSRTPKTGYRAPSHPSLRFGRRFTTRDGPSVITTPAENFMPSLGLLGSFPAPLGS